MKEANLIQFQEHILKKRIKNNENLCLKLQLGGKPGCRGNHHSTALHLDGDGLKE